MTGEFKNILNSSLFFIIFVGIFSLNIFIQDNEVSESERRKLKQFPDISWQKLIDTKFMDDFDKYVLDQFIFRDNFRRIKARVELIHIYQNHP